jgi:hypothetical protein
MILDFGFAILDWGSVARISPVDGNPAGRSEDHSSPTNLLQSQIKNQKSQIPGFSL